LIELLVVMAFISILAAIAISRFRNVKGKGIDATIKTDLRNALTAEEEYYVDQGTFVAFSVSSGGRATELEFTASPEVSVTATLQGAGIRIVGSHPAATNSWCLSTASGEVLAGTIC
jgi:Tfp pilus assembly protein PilE